MFNSSRGSALFISSVVTLLAGIPLVFFSGMGIGFALLWLLVLGLVTFSLFYFLLHHYIFSEVKSIHELLSHIDKKEYDVIQKQYLQTDNPLVQVKKEVADFALQKQLEINELMKLETFRREFLADVSHELKTPIFAAQGFIHTLIDGAIEDERVRDKFLI